MARPLRIEFPGAFYHVTSRGNQRKNIFNDDHDRTVFLDILDRCCNRFNWICHAYCLMGNHYHLVVETVDSTLSRGMRHLNGVYTQKFNWNHHRVGHIFQGRYKAILIERDSHLLEACRYVVLNPIRAHLTTKPEAWPWSSYRGTCGLGKHANCLSLDWLLAQFDETTKKAQRKYRKFVQDGIGARCIWDDLRVQILLGDDEFVLQFRDIAKGVEELAEIPRSQRLLDRPSLDQLFPESVRNHKAIRNRVIVEAVENHSFAQRAVASHLQLHYSTVNRILAKMACERSTVKT